VFAILGAIVNWLEVPLIESFDDEFPNVFFIIVPFQLTVTGYSGAR
jgi:hypothetical protein